MFKSFPTTTNIDQRLRHIPAASADVLFNAIFVCSSCGEQHTLDLTRHAAEAALWGAPVPLPCGASLIVTKPLG